jgi:hypothetical protein
MKLLVGVTNCHKAMYPEALSRKEPPNNALCVKAARETWIKDATSMGVDVVFFFGGPSPDGRVPLEDEVFLPFVPDNYEGLVNKVTAMANWAWWHGYDYFMKVDVDSYVNVAKLLAEKEFFKWDYVGRGWGLGYLLSRHGMKIVMDTRQKYSWAEDSHVLRAIFAHTKKGNKASLYSDGRFVFLPNLIYDDVPLYDKEFIVLNPMTPESMAVLHANPSIEAIMPFSFSEEDLWTGGQDRVEHCSCWNAFVIKGEPMPFNYDEFKELTQYERQPLKDWAQVVFASLEMDCVQDCPSFLEWLGPIDNRKALLDTCIKVNVEAARSLNAASEKFKQDQLGEKRESL